MTTVDEILAAVPFPDPPEDFDPDDEGSVHLLSAATEAWGRAIAAAALRLSALQQLSDSSQALGGYDDPERWQWVPKEPTEDMTHAGYLRLYGDGACRTDAENAYYAMLAAAPARIVAGPAPIEQPADTVCSTHPDAPHGFNRNASHSEHRYVCDCEGWEPPAEPVAQEPVHPSVWAAYADLRNSPEHRKVCEGTAPTPAQPARPMTMRTINSGMDKMLLTHAECEAFAAGARFAERHHGITANPEGAK